MTLKQIESELGDTLFEGERKQVLTPLGAYVRDQALLACQTFETASVGIQQYALGEKGQIRIAAVPSFTTEILPSAIARLRQHTPEIQIDLRDIDSAAVVNAISSGSIDMGFSSLPTQPSGISSPEISSELLVRDPFVCVCRPDHPLSQSGRPVSWSEIAKYPFITSGLCDQIPSSEVKQLSDNARMHLHNVASLAAFVRADFGITLLPRLAVSLVPDLSTATLEDTTAVRHLYLLRHPNRSLSPAAKRLRYWVNQICHERGMGADPMTPTGITD